MKSESFTPESLMDMASGYQKSRLLLTAVDLDVFSILGRETKNARQIAEEITTDSKATERLLNALTAIGLLKKKGIFFYNTPASIRFLDRQSPEFLAGIDHVGNKWRTWNTLTDAVKAGNSVTHSQDSNVDQMRTKYFIDAMHHRAGHNSQKLVQALPEGIIKHILDVGGGSGAYSMAMIQSGRVQKATIFDRPHVIPITKDYIQKAGLSDCMDTRAGDYLTDDFGAGYDLIIMSAILHINSSEENLKLIKKSVQALNPNGLVLIQDFIIDESRTFPEKAALFSLNMLVGTEKGDTYTENEIHHWMSQAGLKDIVRRDYSPSHNLMMGRKK